MAVLDYHRSKIRIIKKGLKNFIQNSYYDIRNPESAEIVEKKLTYLSKEALYNIKENIIKVEREKVPGIFLETGCALGGSTIQIGLAKSPERKLKVYDVFGMIPPPSDKDGKDVTDRYEVIKQGKSKGIGGEEYYGYKKNLLNQVKQNLKDFGLAEKSNIELIQGLYEDTMAINEPVAFAHIDCDWYSSVITCLKNIEPNLSARGVMIIDDYYDWSGCKSAVNDYFKDDSLKNKYVFETKHRKLNIIKKV